MSEQPTVGSIQPKTAPDFIRRGWENRTGGKLDDAEKDFRKAISLDETSVEAYYGLGLMLKSQDRKKEAIENFTKVLEMIDTNPEDRTRNEMLRRLSKGHINMIKGGDWDLEKEIWRKDESDEAEKEPDN
jgi:tetratricopeptide (TPR) repeat protein